MIVIINPNCTVSMTEEMLKTARKTVPHAEFVAWTSHDGPVAIQGPEDGLACVAPLLKLVDKASKAGATAIIIGCFDDTGLKEAQAMARCPVMGIGQAAYHQACLMGPKFSVVTTLDVSVSILERNVQAYGLGQYLARVRASGVEVLALETDPSAENRVIEEIVRAASEDSVTSVVLGCAGMVNISPDVVRDKAVYLIDGVKAAAQFSSMFR